MSTDHVDDTIGDPIDPMIHQQANRRPEVDSQTGGRLDRRSFMKLAAGGVALGALGTAAFREVSRSGPARRPVRLTAGTTGQTKRWHMVATDGYVAMPDPSIVAPIGVYYPDLLAPDGQNLYVFGFTDVTDIPGFRGSGIADPWVPSDLVAPIDFKGLAQISAPLLYCDDGDDIFITLENLGLAVRPDLFDPHTIHWHGFANQIPYFDGVPDSSLSVPSGSELTYHYLPVDVGTYMYHCHVEDVEHVHMGLTGMVFIRPHPSSPRWTPSLGLDANKKYAYYHSSTEYDREYAIILTEANVENHWNDGHIQESDWSEYRSTFGLMNGRSWPDTIEPNGSFFDRDAFTVGHVAPFPDGRWRNSQLSGDAAARLAYQPNSSLIQANAGERVLLRISNLGFDEHSLVLPGLEMTMVGRDAKFLGEGRADYFTDAGTGDGVSTRSDITTKTYRIDLGPGESRDVIFTAPTPSGNPDVYSLYDRSVLFLKKQSAAASALDGYGSMRTEVRIHPGGTLPKQAHPNQLFV